MYGCLLYSALLYAIRCLCLSYGGPGMTDELLDGDQSVVAHVWVQVCHELHRACFSTQVCDDSRNATSI